MGTQASAAMFLRAQVTTTKTTMKAAKARVIESDPGVPEKSEVKAFKVSLLGRARPAG